MDATTKTYQIDKHKQLIPLNGTMVNFSCFFEVKSRDNKPFQIAIVEQGEIKPKQYKLVENGSINGQFESDGQLKSYFMVLKATNPCECDVQVIVKPKEPSAGNENESRVPLPHQPTLASKGTTDGQSPSVGTTHHMPMSQNQTAERLVPSTPESYFQLKYILGISVAIIIVYLLYKYRKTVFGKFFAKDSLAVSISNTSF